MIALIKRLLPVWLKIRLRRAVKAVKYAYRRMAISKPVRRGDKIKIIVGAAETWQPGWYSTNEQWLDISRAADWQAVFKGRRLITHVVAEHVFEHLTQEQSRAALSLIADHLVDGGRVRIAVPDGYHPDSDYLRHVGIGGIGDDAADHKQLLTVDGLTELLVEAGFRPHHVEGYDASGTLITRGWSSEDGYILRSRAHAADSPWTFVDADTSLIVDGVKE